MILKLTLWCLVLIASKNSFLVETRTTTVEKRDACSGTGTDCDSCKSDCKSNPCCATNCVECTSSCTSTNKCGLCQQSCSDVQCSEPSCSNNCNNNCNKNSCTNKCNTNDCKNNNCNNQCNSCTPASQKQEETEEEFIIQEPQNVDIKINNTNTNLVNLTTHLNINNVVNNYNNISVPIFVNNTNINNIDFSNVESINQSSPIIVNNSQNSTSQDQTGYIPYPYYPYPYPYNIPTKPSDQENCCHVIHPKQCFIDENRVPRCIQRRHKECSSRCTSNVIVIDQNQNVKPNCQYINNWPYTYCGQYERQDCGSCYSCNNEYNPNKCFQSEGCSSSCRNNAPSCVPTQLGLQCF